MYITYIFIYISSSFSNRSHHSCRHGNCQKVAFFDCACPSGWHIRLRHRNIPLSLPWTHCSPGPYGASSLISASAPCKVVSNLVPI